MQGCHSGILGWTVDKYGHRTSAASSVAFLGGILFSGQSTNRRGSRLKR